MTRSPSHTFKYWYSDSFVNRFQQTMQNRFTYMILKRNFKLNFNYHIIKKKHKKVVTRNRTIVELFLFWSFCAAEIFSGVYLFRCNSKFVAIFVIHKIFWFLLFEIKIDHWKDCEKSKRQFEKCIPSISCDQSEYFWTIGVSILRVIRPYSNGLLKSLPWKHHETSVSLENPRRIARWCPETPISSWEPHLIQTFWWWRFIGYILGIPKENFDVTFIVWI